MSKFKSYKMSANRSTGASRAAFDRLMEKEKKPRRYKKAYDWSLHDKQVAENSLIYLASENQDPGKGWEWDWIPAEQNQ